MTKGTISTKNTNVFVTKSSAKKANTLRKSVISTPSTTSVEFANGIITALDSLFTQREQWESTDFKKSNDGLYALLSNCQSIFEAKFVNASDDNKRALRLGLIEKFQALGLRVQENMSTLTMFVRFVFNSDRKRANGYASVLRAAISHGVNAANLPTYIENEGGIENIKRKMVQKPEALAKQQALVTAKSQVEADLALATLAPLAQVKLSNVSGEYAVLMVKPNPNGTVDVIGSINDVKEGLFQSLLKQMAKQTVASNQLTNIVRNESIGMFAGVSPSNQSNTNEELEAA